MKLMLRSTALVLAVSAFCMTGCRSARDMFSGNRVAVADVEHHTLMQDEKAGMLAESESQDSSVALVSSTSGQAAANSAVAIPAGPTLRTLAEGEDLMAVIESAPGPVLVDFYADWCGPCRTQGKVLHELESFAAANRAQIIKVDIEKHPVLAKQFQVASLPTLMVIKEGEITSREMGLKRAEEVRNLLR